MTRILYLHGFASGPGSGKARHLGQYLKERGAAVESPDLAAGDFEHLMITGQLQVIERAAAGEAVSLVGSSMGGYLAALYAARHPEVERVVLLAPAFGFARRWAERLGAAEVREWRRRGWTEVFHYAEGKPARLAPDLLVDAERYEEYPDMKQPTLIFHGSRDDVVPPAASQAFASSHANARLEILESGHELTDQLDYMAPRIAGWLAGAGVGS